MYEELAKEFFANKIKNKEKKNITHIFNNLSMGEMGVVGYLTYKKDGVTPGILSTDFNISTARIACILNSLENKKYIRREVSKNDKRKIFVYLEDNAKSMMEEKWNSTINELSNVFALLGEKDAKEFVRLSNKVDYIISNKEEL